MKLENIGQNNKLHKLIIGTKEYYFSYETCIAFYNGKERFITNEKFSVTTSKHKNFLKKDLDFLEVDIKEFNTKLNESLED